MKKLVAMFLAAALATPALAQAQEHPNRPVQNADDRREPSNNTGRGRRDDRPAATGHRFSRGERFVRARASNYQRLNYREYRRLLAPPRGYVWVRAGRDALLVRLSNNVISRVVVNLF